ncbi:MAG: hypothetical protein O9345_17415 [Burkholderiaceae bacterium]|nr:hypothetical protein [Burkholderiales bacterium]MCZ8100822.1 hypothetical protein [Burkholderiales bacterium]MCZ8339908.1 hypothetical protein [Burkholderiaceae bacterium]
MLTLRVSMPDLHRHLQPSGGTVTTIRIGLFGQADWADAAPGRATASDEVRRILEQPRVLGAQGRAADRHVAGDRRVGRDPLHAPRDEGRDRRVVVLEAPDAGTGRRELRQLLVLERAAGDRDRPAGADAARDRRCGGPGALHCAAAPRRRPRLPETMAPTRAR